jgi:hypothetical protein
MKNTDKNLVVSSYRILIAKPLFRSAAPTVIGDYNKVIEHIVNSPDFKNGVEYIKELDGLKFKRISKEAIKRLMSYDAYSEELCTKLFQIY